MKAKTKRDKLLECLEIHVDTLGPAELALTLVVAGCAQLKTAAALLRDGADDARLVSALTEARAALSAALAKLEGQGAEVTTVRVFAAKNLALAEELLALLTA